MHRCSSEPVPRRPFVRNDTRMLGTEFDEGRCSRHDPRHRDAPRPEGSAWPTIQSAPAVPPQPPMPGTVAPTAATPACIGSSLPATPSVPAASTQPHSMMPSTMAPAAATPIPLAAQHCQRCTAHRHRRTRRRGQWPRRRSDAGHWRLSIAADAERRGATELTIRVPRRPGVFAGPKALGPLWGTGLEAGPRRATQGVVSMGAK